MQIDKHEHNSVTRGWAPSVLRSGWFWTILRLGTLAALAVVVAAAWGRRGIDGVTAPDPLMYTNLGNLTFWVVWLMGIVLLVPLVGRAWCGICPLGAVNELTARWGLKRALPRFLRNQNLKAAVLVATVLLLGMYRIHHYPGATAWYLAAAAGAALAAGVLFAGRSMCAYLCPVGGMLGLYGRTAPLGFGVRDREVCRDCQGRECVRGAEALLTAALGSLKASFRMRKYPCPVNLRVWELDGTDRCLMCFNCMRACPLDNVALLSRKPLSSLLNESFPRFSDTVLLSALMGFILLTFSRFWPALQGVLAFPVLQFGPWLGAALRPSLLLWLGMGLPFLVIIIPSALAVWGRSSASVVPAAGLQDRRGWPLKVWLEPRPALTPQDRDGEERIVEKDTVRGLSAVYAPSLIPFLLSAHMVLALVKLNTKLPYLPAAASDPAGVRSYLSIWEIGTRPVPDMVLTMGVVRFLSLVILISGSGLSLWTYFRICRREGRAAPTLLFPLLLLGAAVYGGLFHWLF